MAYNYTRLWMGSKGKVRRAWILEADADSVAEGIKKQFGEKALDRRPSKPKKEKKAA